MLASRREYHPLLKEDIVFLYQLAKILLAEKNQKKRLDLTGKDEAEIEAIEAEITALENKFRQTEFQRAKLETLQKTKHIPVFYTSIKTGETIYTAPEAVALDQTAKPSTATTSPANSLAVLFGSKQPRSPGKLFAKFSPNKNAQPAKLKSSMTLINADGTPGDTAELQHNDARPDGKKKYPAGGTSIKVKWAENVATGELRAHKTFNPVYKQKSMRQRALRSKYLSEKILKQPSQVYSHGGQLTFITQWHAPIKIKEIRLLSIQEQVKYMLDVTYQVAIFHQLDLLVIDLKVDNFVYTKQGAKMIDLDGVTHIGELVRDDVSHVATTEYLDDEALIAHFVTDNFVPYLRVSGRSLDVRSLGVIFSFVFASLRHFLVTERQNPTIRRFVEINPEYANNCNGVKLTKLRAAAAHPELDALIDALTNEDKSLRPASAVEVYQQLRQIALSKKYLTEDQLPPELPTFTVADKVEIYQGLLQVRTASEIDINPAIEVCNRDESFHQNTPDNAVRYDYQTVKNIKFREKVWKLGPAKVNKVIEYSSEDRDTESSYQSPTITESTDISVDAEALAVVNEESQQPVQYHQSNTVIEEAPAHEIIVINERAPEPPQQQQRNDEAQELEHLTDQFKRFVAWIIKIAPNSNEKHGKYLALKKFNEIVQQIKIDNPVTKDELKILAKTFFQLSLSHIRFDFLNTTDTGLKCRSVLSDDPYFKDLRNFLFPERNPDNKQDAKEKRTLTKEGVRYRDIRRFVCGEEMNTKFFSHKNTRIDLDKWNTQPIVAEQSPLTRLVNFKFR